MGKHSTYDWQFHIRQQETSGLSAKEYAKQQGFSAWSFYMNRKRLQSTPSAKHAVMVNPLKSQRLNSESFVHVGLINSSSELTVKFSDGTTVNYNGALSADTLIELICSMRHKNKRYR
jgi:hypothetical protein